MQTNKIIHGDCTIELEKLDNNSVDLVYLDPPFYSQKKHLLSGKDGLRVYEFDDKFESIEDYLLIIRNALISCKRLLKDTGSVFLHCDKNASHHLRILLDDIFGRQNFQSEIVWSYRRWSNSKKGLLNSHQIIFFYSKTNNFKFNTLYTNYSPTTNVDQILHERERNEKGKTVYKTDNNGIAILGGEKKGVPLSDVWDIPFLNPKAKERTGYPTQKPVILLNQVINIASDEGDLVLDPFCGSGTTCVAAKFLNRKFIGIDKSFDAVELTNERLEGGAITESNLLKKGAASYVEKSKEEQEILESIGAVAVQRNSGIDGFLKKHYAGLPVPVKIQDKYDTLDDAIEKLERASRGQEYALMLVVQTKESVSNRLFFTETKVKVIKTMELQLKEMQGNSIITH